MSLEVAGEVLGCAPRTVADAMTRGFAQRKQTHLAMVVIKAVLDFTAAQLQDAQRQMPDGRVAAVPGSPSLGRQPPGEDLDGLDRLRHPAFQGEHADDGRVRVDHLLDRRFRRQAIDLRPGVAQLVGDQPLLGTADGPEVFGLDVDLLAE